VYESSTVIEDRYDSQVWSRAKALEYIAKVAKLDEDLDKAQAALDIGDISSATSQAEAVKKALALLSAEIAKQAAKESK